MLGRNLRHCLVLAMGVIALGAAGCFRHEYVVSGTVAEAEPALSEWQHNFLWGAVSGTRGVDLREVCPAGVARVENGVSALNVLFHLLTAEIYAPTRIRVYCRYLPPTARDAIPEGGAQPERAPRPDPMPAIDASVAADGGVPPAEAAP